MVGAKVSKSSEARSYGELNSPEFGQKFDFGGID